MKYKNETGKPASKRALPNLAIPSVASLFFKSAITDAYSGRLKEANKKIAACNRIFNQVKDAESYRVAEDKMRELLSEWEVSL
jgi:hypothetical protein